MAAKKKAAKPARKAAKKAVRKTKRAAAPRKTARLWLMFPQRLITKPVVWELSQKFPVITNVRQASVTGEIGLVCLELDGLANDVKKAVAWLERRGVSVEPVEINVIGSLTLSAWPSVLPTPGVFRVTEVPSRSRPDASKPAQARMPQRIPPVGRLGAQQIRPKETAPSPPGIFRPSLAL